jgi:uncharacterized membrane protein YdjX (TVP38/TMEM64 family)
MEDKKKPNKKSETLHSIVSLLALLVILAVSIILFNLIGEDKIQKWVSMGGIWGPILFICIHALSIIFAPFEGSFLMFSSGRIFGNYWLAVFYVIVAGFLGSSVNFWLARKFGQKVVKKVAGKKALAVINEYSQKVNEHPVWLVPLMATGLFDIVSYAAGLSKIKYRNFLIAISLSSIINVPIYVAVGNGVIGNKQALPWIIGLVLLTVLFYFIIKFILNKLNPKKAT